MTLTEEDLVSGSLYSIQQTQDRGRAVYAARDIPEKTTVHVARQPFVSVIKEKFKKEVCAWCFKYEYGKNCAVKHKNPLSGVSFCSEECLDEWNGFDYDGKVVEAWASLRTSKARKQISAQEDFPLDQAKLVAAAVVQRNREGLKSKDTPSWNEVLYLQPGVFDDEIDLPSEIKQIVPFLMENLPEELRSFVECTAYPFLSRHLSNSFGIWELPISPDSENLGSAMYPSASYFNHSCDPNIAKVRCGRAVLFVTSKEISKGEELCISYGHTERHGEERQQVLRDWWGFNCNCHRCIKELKDLEFTKQT